MRRHPLLVTSIHWSIIEKMITSSSIIFWVALFGTIGIHGVSLAEDGIWSKETILLSENPQTRKIQIVSPDKGMTATIDGIKLQVEKMGRRFSGIENESVATLAELGWSPDSRAFFITASDGGLVGSWSARIYFIEDAKVRPLNLTPGIVKRFKKQYTCSEPEEPNIAAIKWWNGSDKLLFVAEVPPHSTCPGMGKVMGYLVAIPSGKIIKEISEKKLKSDWGAYLGQRLTAEGARIQNQSLK